MSQNSGDFNLFLPGGEPPDDRASSSGTARKFIARLKPGQICYDIEHDLGTKDVLVQTRIAGRVREGGISIVDENTVRIEFGGVLNEDMDVVIIG